MSLDQCQQMPVGTVIEARITFLAGDWNTIIVKSVEGEIVKIKAHLYQTTWGPYDLHFSHFKEWRIVCH